MKCRFFYLRPFQHRRPSRLLSAVSIDEGLFIVITTRYNNDLITENPIHQTMLLIYSP